MVGAGGGGGGAAALVAPGAAGLSSATATPVSASAAGVSSSFLATALAFGLALAFALLGVATRAFLMSTFSDVSTAELLPSVLNHSRMVVYRPIEMLDMWFLTTSAGTPSA